MTSIARREDQDESVDSSDASQEVDQNNSRNDVVQNESEYDSEASDSEHSDGDPENQDKKGEDEKKVDDDEDRSNPQYIPKRGTFYEHDDRTAASGEESSNTTSEVSEKKEGSESGQGERKRPPRKSEGVNKWSHDKYNENEQMPKSRDELVAIYGYDIRNEDAPPHARRNRRYGRGPNKYTRTWEDEDAYRRQAAVTATPTPRRPPRPEDFPELDGRPGKRRPQRPRSKSQPNSVESLENGTTLRRNASVKTKGKVTPRTPNNRTAANKNHVIKAKDSKEKLPAIENLTITTSVVNNNSQPQRKVNATVGQQKPVPTEQAKKKPAPQPQPPQQNNVSTNKSPPQQQSQQKPQNQQISQQPQGQQNNASLENRAGSKRYSSLRQRPLAEAYAPQSTAQQAPPQAQPAAQPQLPPAQPAQVQTHRYHNEYNSGNQPSPHQGSPAPQPHPQQMMHQVNQQVHRTAAVKQQPHGPSPPHQQLPQQQLPQQQLPQQQLPQQQLAQQQLPQQQLAQQQLPQQPQQAVRLNLLEQQQLVQHQHHSLHSLPQAHAMGQMQTAQGYAPPAIMPAQYMQQGPGFGGAALFAQPPAPYPQHLYQHHNYATQAGGVTYYSCAEPEQNSRPQRRPTAAIPIVRPAPPQRQANSSEKDNIDRIVENMFVRKPWPSTCDAKDKDKSQADRNSQEPSKEAPSIPAEAKPVESKEEIPNTPAEQETKSETPKITENVEIVETQQEVVDTTQSA